MKPSLAEKGDRYIGLEASHMRECARRPALFIADCDVFGRKAVVAEQLRRDSDVGSELLSEVFIEACCSQRVSSYLGKVRCHSRDMALGQQ